MSQWESFDMAAYMASFTDAELIQAVKRCAKDLTMASTEQPNSEWHQACFAGMLCYSREMSDRGLKMDTVH